MDMILYIGTLNLVRGVFPIYLLLQSACQQKLMRIDWILMLREWSPYGSVGWT
jgi:hypothetical protein